MTDVDNLWAVWDNYATEKDRCYSHDRRASQRVCAILTMFLGYSHDGWLSCAINVEVLSLLCMGR